MYCLGTLTRLSAGLMNGEKPNKSPVSGSLLLIISSSIVVGYCSNVYIAGVVSE